MVSPRKLKLSTTSIALLFIRILGITVLFCGVWNNINFDFATLRDNLFTGNHSRILDNSLFML